MKKFCNTENPPQRCLSASRKILKNFKIDAAANKLDSTQVRKSERRPIIKLESAEDTCTHTEKKREER